MFSDPRPLISVVVPTHNRPDVLQRALESVASQTEQDVEVIVVDDGSTPEHAPAIDAAIGQLGSRCRLVRRPSEGVRHGPDFARNSGVEAARGQYVTFLDDDDYWCDHRHLEVAARCLRARPDVDYYVASQRAMLEDTIVVPEWMPELGKRARKRQPIIDGVFEVCRKDLLWGGGIGFAHVNISIVRRELVQQIGGFWGDAGYEGDLNFFLRVVDQAQTFAHCPTVVSVNTVREPSNLSGVSSIAQNSKTLLRATHGQHALLHCSTPEVRRYTRALLSGCFKKLSKQQWSAGDCRNASLSARQAVVTQPSVRWFLIALMTSSVAALAPLRWLHRSVR